MGSKMLKIVSRLHSNGSQRQQKTVKWHQHESKGAPRWAQEASRWLQEAPEYPQGSSKVLQGGSKMRQDGPKRLHNGLKKPKDEPKMSLRGHTMSPKCSKMLRNGAHRSQDGTQDGFEMLIAQTSKIIDFPLFFQYKSLPGTSVWQLSCFQMASEIDKIEKYVLICSKMVPRHS